MIRWLYVGCKLSELPPNFLVDSKKLTKDQIKEVLESIPIEDGSAEADSEDSLVRILISNGIFPIKIKPCNTIDNRILRLKAIRNIASKSSNIDKYIDEVRVLNEIVPIPKKFNYKPILLIILLITLVTILYYTTMRI
jgi:hypothetical protein